MSITAKRLWSSGSLLHHCLDENYPKVGGSSNKRFPFKSRFPPSSLHQFFESHSPTLECEGCDAGGNVCSLCFQINVRINFVHALHLSFIVLAGWPRDLNRRQSVQKSSLETRWCIVLHKINLEHANSVARLCDPTNTAAVQITVIQNYSKVHLCGAKCVWHDALLFKTAKQSTYACLHNFSTSFKSTVHIIEVL